MVTRESNPQGFGLMELAMRANIIGEFVIFERGMPEENLRLLYIISDVFFL